MCAHALSLQHPCSTRAHAPFQLYGMCVCKFTHTRRQVYRSSRFICKSTFFSLIHLSLHCSSHHPLPPTPPQPPHLSVWEKPVGFVLSVTSCIVDVPSPEGEVPRFGACPVIPYLSKCFSYFSIKQRTIRKYSGIKRKWTNGI